MARVAVPRLPRESEAGAACICWTMPVDLEGEVPFAFLGIKSGQKPSVGPQCFLEDF